jgi:DNA-binding NarL/FixJ family response regulator
LTDPGSVHALAPSRYTEEQLEQIKKSVGGMGGRDKAAHSERTKSGMVMAIERGAKPGQPSKLTDAQWEEVEQLLAQGISPADIADKFGISRQTIYVRYNRDAIKELRLAHEKTRAEEERKDGATGTRH